MKTMLITGATSGIGLALAREAATQGYAVIAAGRNQSVLNQLNHENSITTVCFDVTDADDCQKSLGELQFDIAVLNAGVCEYVDVEDFETDLFHRVFNANFFGVVNCVNGLLPQLTNNKQLVIVDSLARLLPFTRSSAYGASKAALHYFTKSLEVDLSDTEVLVQSVSPGFVATPLTDKNDFDMPSKVSVEFAAQQIIKGIESKSKSIYFPFIFSSILRLLAHFPSSIKVRLSKLLKSNKNTSEA